MLAVWPARLSTFGSYLFLSSCKLTHYLPCKKSYEFQLRLLAPTRTKLSTSTVQLHIKRSIRLRFRFRSRRMGPGTRYFTHVVVWVQLSVHITWQEGRKSPVDGIWRVFRTSQLHCILLDNAGRYWLLRRVDNWKPDPLPQKKGRVWYIQALSHWNACN